MLNCTRCGGTGAGSAYNGGVFHMSCRIEQKREDGVLGETPTGKPTQPRLRGTGNGRKKKTKKTPVWNTEEVARLRRGAAQPDGRPSYGKVDRARKA